VSSATGQPRWVERPRSLPQLVESLQPQLRHGQRAAPAYLIAAQYFCEEQVELALVRGEVAIPEMDEGKQVHEMILTVKPAKLEELIAKIISGWRCA